MTTRDAGGRDAAQLVVEKDNGAGERALFLGVRCRKRQRRRGVALVFGGYVVENDNVLSFSTSGSLGRLAQFGFSL